jgi:hypothetical protein
MKKVRILTSMLVLIPLAISFVGCNTNANDNEQNTNMIYDVNPEPFNIANIPYQMTYNNIEYDIIEEPENLKQDKLLAYWVNNIDFKTFYKEDPDAQYIVDETDCIVNAANNNKVEIYSIKNYDTEQYIGLLYGCPPNGELYVYINSNY